MVSDSPEPESLSDRLRSRRTRLAVVAVWIAFSGAAVLQGQGSGDAGSSPSPGATGTSASPSAVMTASPTTAPTLAPTASSSPSPSASASPSPSVTASPPVSAESADHPWQPDASLVQAKNESRVAIDASGRVAVLAAGSSPAPTPGYAPAAALDTKWSGLIQEPPRTGTDDKGAAYTDYNYSLFCGAGTAAVVLYYWPAAREAVTTTAGSFAEPVDLGANRYAKTYWTAASARGNARGTIAYLAEVELPAPDQGSSWWPKPGLMNWTAKPPSTNVENLIDGINWEASGRTTVDYFYVIVRASQLTAAALRDHVHADIAAGVPVVIAARTSDGKNALPYWNVKSTASAVNHFVTVVGYDDAAGTYAVMDTCGTTCNDRNVRAGVRSMDQAALFSLIAAESDDDGIMW